MTTTIYNSDGMNSMSVTRYTHDIAVLLITFPDLPAGPEVLNDTHGTSAPSRDILF